ncbi:MAG: hypothetical protein ABI644_08940 [Arenimonas sp.]
MKKQIVRIAPVQTAKVVAVLYFVVSIPFIAIMAISLMFTPKGSGPGLAFMIAIPFLYLVFGFIFTALAAWIYNQVAKYVGGIEYTASEVE